MDENGNNSNNYYPGTNITYQQLNPLSVGAAYLGVSREISVGIAGGIAKVFSEASQTTKPLLKEGINLAEQIGEKSYSSFSSLKSAVKKEYQIAKDIDLHHVVEQNKTNIAQFGQEALQNTKNIVPLARDVHRQVSGAYSRSFTSVKGTYSRYRDYVQTLDFNSQYQKGVEIINKITK